MASFTISIFIKNTPEVVFDLSRNIDMHIISTAGTDEKAIAGVTTGLIEMNETVTWQAKHLFKTRLFTSQITAFDFPNTFTDQMIKGDLKSFHHKHTFKAVEGGTEVRDEVVLTAPFGILGKIVMELFLKDYFRRLLTKRNEVIKEYAENKHKNK
jgi:ligand-binding SRPBCC domain-containing protein